jgi:DNA polymerase-3 subunit alpha
MYKFDCGCEFPILDDKIKPETGLPSIDLDFSRINFECPKTWELFKSGNTKGIFQLETYLGQAWSKKSQPESLEDISAIISAIRPGVLKAFVDGKSMTQHYADRKIGQEEVTVLDLSIEDILRPTQGILIYQEQSILIARKLGGFNLAQADILRRAMGKKEADTMTQVENMFIEGCKTVGLVTEEKAREIWSWIRKSERYAFNKSHAISYAKTGYYTAVVKAHFPLQFYCSWLKHAKEKIDPQKEVKDLVADAKTFDIDIRKPSLKHLKNGEDFAIIDKAVYFGARNIKRVGDASVQKLIKIVDKTESILHNTVDQFTWYQFLIYVTPEVGKTVVSNLILAGALEYMNLPRKKMLYEYNIWAELTDKEQSFIVKNPQENLILSLLYLLEKHKLTQKRKDIINSLILMLNKPPSNLIDLPGWINKTEEDILGVSLTCSKLDGLSTMMADTKCKELNDGKSSESILCIEIKEVKEVMVKRGASSGQKMGFLKIEDDSGVAENIVVFCKEWNEYKDLLYPHNTVTLYGEKSNKGSFAVKLVKQI